MTAPDPERGGRLKISVIIPTFNRKELLLRTVGALLRQDFAPYEVIVVDNGSSDGTPEAVAALGNAGVTCVREAVRGPAAARNRGVGEASGDVIAFIDDDAVPASDWAAVIGEFFAQEPDGAGAGGPALPLWEGGRPPDFILNSVKLQSYLGVFDLGREKRKISGFYDFLIGTNCAYRASVFGSGTRFLHVEAGRPGTSEDLELSRRVGAERPVYYLPEMKVTHFIAAYKYSPRYIAALVFDCGLKKPFIGRRISPRGPADMWGVDGLLGVISLAGYVCGLLLKSGRGLARALKRR